MTQPTPPPGDDYFGYPYQTLENYSVGAGQGPMTPDDLYFTGETPDSGDYTPSPDTAASRGTTLKEVERQIMGEQPGTTAERGDQFANVAAMLANTQSQLQSQTQKLAAEWESPAAKDVFMSKVGETLAYLKVWQNAANRNASALHGLAQVMTEAQEDMRELLRQYEAEMGAAGDRTVPGNEPNPAEGLRAGREQDAVVEKYDRLARELASRVAGEYVPYLGQLSAGRAMRLDPLNAVSHPGAFGMPLPNVGAPPGAPGSAPPSGAPDAPTGSAPPTGAPNAPTGSAPPSSAPDAPTGAAPPTGAPDAPTGSAPPTGAPGVPPGTTPPGGAPPPGPAPVPPGGVPALVPPVAPGRFGLPIGRIGGPAPTGLPGTPTPFGPPGTALGGAPPSTISNTMSTPGVGAPTTPGSAPPGTLTPPPPGGAPAQPQKQQGRILNARNPGNPNGTALPPETRGTRPPTGQGAVPPGTGAPGSPNSRNGGQSTRATLSTEIPEAFQPPPTSGPSVLGNDQRRTRPGSSAEAPTSPSASSDVPPPVLSNPHRTGPAKTFTERRAQRRRDREQTRQQQPASEFAAELPISIAPVLQARTTREIDVPAELRAQVPVVLRAEPTTAADEHVAPKVSADRTSRHAQPSQPAPLAEQAAWEVETPGGPVVSGEAEYHYRAEPTPTLNGRS
ncbi:hypothetical protein MOQ72_27610 [Saccharopolyspora sp. K220]|uniref:hypothetical protein n=1 Tax=Saccharopolyspora soli TaxID=2926618 RepID=UPI001F567795|nr:hypothetical protein [Saccharopolyspora soli]MCI2421215.1 hypothetical protein [Saccharopolyspora soli]